MRGLVLPFLLAAAWAQAYLPFEAGHTWAYSDGMVQKVLSGRGSGRFWSTGRLPLRLWPRKEERSPSAGISFS